MHAVFPKIVTLFNSLAARAAYMYMYVDSIYWWLTPVLTWVTTPNGPSNLYTIIYNFLKPSYNASP